MTAKPAAHTRRNDSFLGPNRKSSGEGRLEEERDESRKGVWGELLGDSHEAEERLWPLLVGRLTRNMEQVVSSVPGTWTHFLGLPYFKPNS